MRLSNAVPLAFALLAVAPAASAEPAMRFSGRVEPSRSVVVANHVTGVVEELRFAGGEEIAAGDLIARIDPRDFAIAQRVARAAVAEAEATLRLAEDDAGRQAELLGRGTGTRVTALQAEIARDTAAAQLDARRAELAAADLAVRRATVNAPIGGTISPPRVTEGSFVEAEAGTQLAEIVQLDPVRVAYQVSYAQRSDAMAAAGATTASDLFARLRLTLTLPSGEAYPHPGRPLFESAAIDPATDTLTVWGLFPNPDRTLVPNLAVTVTATFAPEARP